MLPDIQHGTISGYKYRGCRCDDCSQASARYEKRRKWLIHQGMNPTLPAHGFTRRVHALMVIGWTQRAIAEALGISQGNLAAKLRLNTFVRRATHEAMCEVYEARCMSPQYGMVNQRTARIAAKNQWAAPLSWDDIDDLGEQPSGIRKPYHGGPARDSIDPIVVDRLMGGDFTVHSTAAERSEVCRRWVANGGALAELERKAGWKPERYHRINEGDEAA